LLTNKTISELLDAFSSPDPTPGGGSASALAGALGASLLAMVAGMARTKSGTPEEREALDAARADLLALQGSLKELVDLDASAYALVVAAYRQPKDTDEQRQARLATIQQAMRMATQVPLETMRACANVIRIARTVSAFGNPSASSDVKVGVHLALAGFRGGAHNVEINFGALKDPEVIKPLQESMRKMIEEMAEAGESDLTSPDAAAAPSGSPEAHGSGTPAPRTNNR
jgi:formiminotetrahydrofolate cyclodeaminase